MLAISVFLAHTGSFFGFRLVGSSVAVQSFFIISGFYMALILNEKYTGPRSYYLFITNRLLRLMPAYWVALAATVLAIYALAPYAWEDPWVSKNFAEHFGRLDILTRATVVFSNIFIIGQDLLMIFKADPGGFLSFTQDPFKVTMGGIPPLFSFFFIPQAWSIGTELLFYFTAPFLVRRRSPALLALISLSLLLRVWLYYAGYTDRVWQFQFFPTELAMFLMGALSYKLYRSSKGFFGPRFGLLATAALIGATLAYQFVPAPSLQGVDMKKWVYYAVLIALMPAVFSYTARSAVDRYLGELSYPIYITHYSVLWLWIMFRQGLLDRVNINLVQVAMLALTLLLSVGLVHLVIKPMERYRQARVLKIPATAARQGAQDG